MTCLGYVGFLERCIISYWIDGTYYEFTLFWLLKIFFKIKFMQRNFYPFGFWINAVSQHYLISTVESIIYFCYFLFPYQQDDCSVASIIKNFTSNNENSSLVFSNKFPDIARTSSLTDQLLMNHQFDSEFVSENSSSQPKTRETVKNLSPDGKSLKSSRISLEAEFIGFVMDMQDKVVEISCNVRVSFYIYYIR